MFAAIPSCCGCSTRQPGDRGTEPGAGGSVVAYAVQLIDPAAPSFAHVMKRIAYKHISLRYPPGAVHGRRPSSPDAVAEVLGEAVTPAIAAAWNEVYWLFATQLSPKRPGCTSKPISIPTATDATVPGGAHDRGNRRCRLPRPGAGRWLAVYRDRSGQYVSVFVDLPDGSRQPRQYTVSSTALGTRMQITVRRVRGATARRTARSPRTCTTASTRATCWRSAHRLATSSSSRLTGRFCWPAPGPASRRCCRSSNTSRACNLNAR